MADAAGEALTLSDILDDLRRVVDIAIEQDEGGTATYESMQSNLPGLALHVLTYIRFLENHGYLEYDRVADHIRVEDRGRQAVGDPDVWSGEARKAFADHIEDGVADVSDVFDDADMDQLLDSVIEEDANPEDIIQVDDGLDITPNTGFDAPPFEDDEEEDDSPTGIHTVDEIPQSEPSNMTQDTFASRRLSTGASASPARSTGGDLYDRQEAIGSGGYGTVYKGLQVKLNRQVAIKEIKEIFDVFAGVQRADIVTRFTQIVQTQASLLHPNIIQLVDVDTDSQFP